MSEQSVDLKTIRPAGPSRTLSNRAQPGKAGTAALRLADRMATWAIWAVMLGGIGREVLGRTDLVQLGFYTLHVVDPAVVLTFLAWGLYQLQRPPRGGLIVVPALAIAALLLLNFARGMASDSALALLWARVTLEIAGLLLLGLTCSLNTRLQSTLRRALVTAASIMAGLVVLRLIFGVALFMTVGPVDAVVGINDGGRPLATGGAFVMGLAVALLFSEAIREGRNRGWAKAGMAFVLLVAEAFSGQGTATIATIVMLLIVAMLERGALRGLRAILVLLILVLAMGVALTISFDDFANAASGSWNLSRRSGTFAARQEIWAELMRRFPQLPLFDQLFGLPAGQQPTLVVYLSKRQAVWSMSIHSMYYGALPMMGYVGLIAYVSLLLLLFLKTFSAALGASRENPFPSFPVAFCVGTAIFSISYEVRNEQIFALFAAIWWTRYATQARRSAKRAPARVGQT